VRVDKGTQIFDDNVDLLIIAFRTRSQTFSLEIPIDALQYHIQNRKYR
jgi:hypothetical protein